MRISIKNVEETQAIAEKLAAVVEPGTTILLNGDLGAGKTTFTQGFARALGIKRPLKSPTFTLVREYQAPEFPLYHLDVYRLGEEGGAEELGLAEYFGGDAVALVEWSEFIQSELPADHLVIDLDRVEYDPTNDQRVMTLTAQGPQATAVLAAAQLEEG